ncbi:MAG: PAS domain S-box protein [Candidatus Hydrothermarchaeota archaeon]
MKRIEKNMKQTDQLLESERELAIRNQIANIFLTIPDEEMYGEVLQVILQVVESKYGIFGYIDEDGALVCPSMTREIWEKCKVPDKDIVFPRDAWRGIWGRALIEKKTLCSNKPLRVPEGHIPILRVLVVPIIHQENVIGILAVANKATDYTEKDQKMLETIATHIAPVLHARLQRDREERDRKRAEEALRKAHEELEIRVQERTVELEKINEILQAEIIERKLSEEALRESEEKYRAIFESTGTATVIIEEDTTLSMVNSQFEELSGYSREEIEGKKSWTEFVLKDDLEKMKEYHRLRRIDEDAAPRNYEFRFIDRHGRIKDIFLTVAMIPGTKKSVASLLDVTERKRAEKELKASKEKLRQTAEEIRGFLESLHEGLTQTLGTGAAGVLYNVGHESGRRSFGYLLEVWSKMKEEEKINAYKSHFSQISWFDLDKINVDKEKNIVDLRVKNNFETAPYKGRAESSVCHFLRGYLSGFTECALGLEELVCREPKCQGKGDDFCEFMIKKWF